MVVQRHNDEHHREELPAGTWMVIWCCDWLTILHTVSSRYVKLNATVLGDECDCVEGIVITLETRLVSRSAEWIGSFLGLCSKTWDDGGETWLDYLVNRVLAKNEGSHPEKIVRKPRNSCSVKSGGGEHTDNSGPKCAQSWNQYKQIPRKSSENRRLLTGANLDVRLVWDVDRTRE